MVIAMRNIDTIRSVFDSHGGMMRTGDLSREKIYYADIQWLIREGYIEKVRTGCTMVIVTGRRESGIWR